MEGMITIIKIKIFTDYRTRFLLFCLPKARKLDNEQFMIEMPIFLDDPERCKAVDQHVTQSKYLDTPLSYQL